MLTGRSARESGFAIPMALVMMVIASVLIVAISVVVTSTLDQNADRRDYALGTGPAEDGVRAYRKALDSWLIGEHTAFRFTAAAINASVTSPTDTNPACTGPTDPLCVVPNTATSFQNVDSTVPAADRLTVRRMIRPGDFRFWQVLAISQPQLGRKYTANNELVSPGGVVRVFIRGWQGPISTTTSTKVRPVIMRAEIRASSFADFQMVTDGKIRIGPGATIDGKIHSNGFQQSYLDQFDADHFNSIEINDTVVCKNNARFSTTAGSVDNNSPNCNARMLFANSGERYSLLRAEQSLTRVAALCGAATPVQVYCRRATPAAQVGQYTVQINAPTGTASPLTTRQTMTISGNGMAPATIDLTNQRTSLGAGGRFGTVFIADRSVRITGTTLAPYSRLTIFAYNAQPRELVETPAIWLETSDIGYPTGTAHDPWASLGLVAQGDIIVNERVACPLRFRGAMLSQGGMVTMRPDVRGVPLARPERGMCAPGGIDPAGRSRAGNDNSLLIAGSISGHYAPYVNWTADDPTTADPSFVTMAGYENRRYRYDEDLYNNPPPLYPTATTWELVSAAPASAECFTETTGPTGIVPTLRAIDGCE